ncbi:MAG: hypothetical protein ACLUO4_08190 [Christensenellales bacterium]|jgi:hypothetical protein
MEKKYPKKRWMSSFDHVLLMVAWLFWIVIMGMTIYGQLTENPGINMIIYVAICMVCLMSIAIYLKPRVYSYVQLKEDGIYWKSVWGRTYVYFPWEDVEQAGFAQGVSLTMVNDLDSAVKGAIQSKADTTAYVSTKKIRDYNDIVEAVKITRQKGKGLFSSREIIKKGDIYFICYEARKKQIEGIKEELIGYIGEEKWAGEMDLASLIGEEEAKKWKEEVERARTEKKPASYYAKIIFFAICIILTLLAGFKDDYVKGKSRRNAPEALVKAEDITQTFENT